MEGKKFNFEEFIYRNRFLASILLAGVVLLGAGVLISRQYVGSERIEVLESPTEAQDKPSEVVVEVGGQVINPGVYKFSGVARVDDALTSAGGLSAEADRNWVEKNINRAAKLLDGAKIYIPTVGEQSNSVSANNTSGVQTASSPRGSGLVNVNSASQPQLEELPGIGPVYAQSIIEHRPYSNTEELLSKGALKNATYEKVKDLVSVF